MCLEPRAHNSPPASAPRLLALSAVCPGASTLIGNLLKSSAVRPLQSQQRTLAGREWLRAYVNGCAYQVGPRLVQGGTGVRGWHARDACMQGGGGGAEQPS